MYVGGGVGEGIRARVEITEVGWVGEGGWVGGGGGERGVVFGSVKN